MLKLQKESDTLAAQLEDAETKASAAMKSANTNEKEALQLEEYKEQKRNFEKKMTELTFQMQEVKKKDATIEFKVQRTKVLELEKQKNFDKVLAEEKVAEDAAERVGKQSGEI
jgi:hypothetical protein